MMRANSFGCVMIINLILHPHCPFDYCVNDTVVFSLNNTDIQCANNRSGLLCGACKKDYSLILGTFRCEKCTDSHLFLLIPFTVMGVALIFFLLVCKLTVATGMLSGLQCQGMLNGTMASLHGLEQESSSRGRMSSVETFENHRRYRGGRHHSAGPSENF